MKFSNVIALVFLIVGLAMCVQSRQDDEKSSSSSSKVSEATKLGNTLSPYECAQIKEKTSSIFVSSRGFSNPRPGVLYLRAAAWGQASEDARSKIAQALAAQKACALDVNPYSTTIEIRDTLTNKLISSGPVYDLKDQ